MTDLFKGCNHSGWSVSDQVDILRPSLESFGNSNTSNCSATNRTARSLNNYEKSRRPLRHSNNLIVERKAYPLPHPSEFEKPSIAAPPSSDPTNDILHPMQPLMHSTERERQKPREEDDSANSPSEQPSTAAMEQPTSSIHVTDKQPSPSPSLRNCLEQANRSADNSAESEVLGFLQEQDVAVKKTEELQEGGLRPKSSSRVVVVYDGEKKFTTAPLDIAINGYATSEGDAIVVVAFLEHIMSPMGMKMVADMEQFSGVNDAILKQAVCSKKRDIESKLRETSRLQLCQMKSILLDVKVLPGSNPKALVAKEILAYQATSVIFDKNAMKNRKYYEENLSCHVLRLRSDGRRVETVSLFSQGLTNGGSVTSHCSDSSCDSLSSEPACNSPSIWSKLNIFVSKSSTGPLRHSHGGRGSIGSSSRSSSDSGSPRPVLQEEDETTAEALEESFSFDTPKPNPAEALEESFSFDTPKPNRAEALEESFSFDTPKPNRAEAYVYAAAGLDNYSLYTRRNGRTFPTALGA